MGNTKQAVAGDIIRYVGPTIHSLKHGEIFEITNDGHSEWMGGIYAAFTDSEGEKRAFWTPSKYEIIGKLTPKPPVIDINGNAINVGDTIAYAFAGSAHRHMALFEVQSINGPTALCRSKADGVVITLGVFEERAIKI